MKNIKITIKNVKMTKKLSTLIYMILIFVLFLFYFILFYKKVAKIFINFYSWWFSFSFWEFYSKKNYKKFK